MSHKVHSLVSCSPFQKHLVILGLGHMEYGFGVPERTGSPSITITVRDMDEYELGEDWEGEDRFEEVGGKVPADYVVFY